MNHVLITNISSKAGVLELQGRFTYEKIKLDINQIFDKKCILQFT